MARRGKLFLGQLESLAVTQQRLSIHQDVVTAKQASAPRIKPLAHETATAGETARRHVERFSHQFACKRSLRDQSRTDVIALAEQLRDEVKALAEAVGKFTVTNATIARAWFQLDEVETYSGRA